MVNLKSGKSEVIIIKDCTVEANYWQKRSITWPLCGSIATCESVLAYDKSMHMLLFAKSSSIISQCNKNVVWYICYCYEQVKSNTFVTGEFLVYVFIANTIISANCHYISSDTVSAARCIRWQSGMFIIRYIVWRVWQPRRPGCVQNKFSVPYMGIVKIWDIA